MEWAITNAPCADTIFKSRQKSALTAMKQFGKTLKYWIGKLMILNYQT